VVVNFLRANGGVYVIVVVMTAWKRLMSLDRKLCLFVRLTANNGWSRASKHSMERGSRTLQDEYKKESSRAKKDRSVVILNLL
jgi:hypothetical protein